MKLKWLMRILLLIKVSERERAEGPLARFGRVASKTRLPYSNVPGNLFLKWLSFFLYVSPKKGTPITQEPDIVESCGLRHFVALSRAEIKFFSDFEKCARGRAEGLKTKFTLPSLTQERFDLGSSTLRHFVAKSISHSMITSNFKQYVSGRAQGPMFLWFEKFWNAYNSRTRHCRGLQFVTFFSPKPCGDQVFFRFCKKRAQEGRRPKNCFYVTLSNSRTVWRRKFNFALFCSPKYPSFN